MPFKNFVDGSRLDDVDVNRYWLQQAYVSKTVDESVTSSITLQDDDELVLPLLANTDYWFECFILYGASVTSDLRLLFTIPSGTVYDLVHNGIRSGHVTTDPLPVQAGIDTVSRAQFTQASSGGVPGGINATGNTNVAVCPVEGRVIVGNTAGSIRLQWAQNTSSATATIVKASSIMILQRLTV